MNCNNETLFLIIALLFAGVFIVLRHLYAMGHPRCIHCGKRSRRKNWRRVNYYNSKNNGHHICPKCNRISKIEF